MDLLTKRIICSLVFLVCSYGVTKGQTRPFNVTIHDDGNFTVFVGDKVWLRSGPTFFNKDGLRWASDGDLKLLDHRSTGDMYGTETEFVYGYGNGTAAVATIIKTFNGKNKVIFTQSYYVGAANTSLGGSSSYNQTMTGFPTFQVVDPDEPLGFLSFGGYMFGDTGKTTGRFTSTTTNINDGISGGPLALFNQNGKTVIISPYNNFMAASLWQDGSHVTWGIMGGVNNIPADFTYSTILFYGDSINSAFFDWGYELRKQFGISNGIFKAKNASQDVSLNYLGYWTDNGAYYYYHPETSKTYEDTLKDVKKYANDQHIPYKYVQIDSWWYPKDTDFNAVTSWTAKSSVFPHGLKNLGDSTGWKYVAHNRYWSKKAVYAKQNNGTFNWIIGNYGSLPNDLEFWRFLFKQAKAWGLTVYEQDWLNIQTRYMAALQTSLTLGRNWLMQMGQAAAENNLTVQYCMATARHAYQSLEIPAVTQARVSDDYQYLRPDQWKIGVTSIFASAMELYPSKDTFWTSTQQPGNPFGKTEPYPALEAAVASLSKGPVGPSDGIGFTNTSLLMRCCRQDGLLLKPSSVARAIDKQIIADAFNFPTKLGEVWMVQSFINVNGKDKEYGIMFAADVNGQTSVTVADLGFNVLTSGIYYPYNDVSQWKHFTATTSIDLHGCSKANFCLYYFSPIMNSSVSAILGEDNKWVPMSPQRIDGIVAAPDKTTVSFKGAPSEIIKFWYIDSSMPSGQLQQASCIIRASGDVTKCDLVPTSPSNTSGLPRENGVAMFVVAMLLTLQKMYYS